MNGHLFEPPPPVTPIRKLTDRQQHAWDLIRATPGGVTADEIGAHLHAHRDHRPHPEDERCEWCAISGREVATSAALRPLVIYRRGNGKFEPRREEDRAAEAPPASSQIDGLAGESFADIFRRDAA